MEAEQYKRMAAQAASELLQQKLATVPAAVIGVGTGSTVNYFIELLGGRGIVGAVASSDATAARLQQVGVSVVELTGEAPLTIYIDGADEVAPDFSLIKGGGGALTREKIIADASAEFVCILSEEKVVSELGAFPLPVEVIPMAQAHLSTRLRQLGAQVRVRAVASDNGNCILDVSGLDVSTPLELELELERWPGVVGCGLFARNRPNLVLVGGPDGVRRLQRG